MKRNAVNEAAQRSSNSARGAHNRSSGNTFESMINEANSFYRDATYADIDKTPEPLRVIGRMPNGHFECIFTKKAQPDYAGMRTSKNGGLPVSVKFEAKHTETDRIKQSCITDEQAKRLNSFENNYLADCFVLVSFGYKLFYKIPWSVFRDMKSLYGRKYMFPSEMQEYKVKFTDGILDYLDYFTA